MSRSGGEVFRRRKREPAIDLEIEPLASDRGFRLVGAIDVFTTDALSAALEPELHGTLVLDLAAVDYTDDSGLGLLIRTARRLCEQEGCLVLRNAHGNVQRVLEVTGMAQIPCLRIEPHGAGSEA